MQSDAQLQRASYLSESAWCSEPRISFSSRQVLESCRQTTVRGHALVRLHGRCTHVSAGPYMHGREETTGREAACAAGDPPRDYTV